MTGTLFYYIIEILPSSANILSHSSNMKCLTFFKLIVLLLISARILPGVPTTICGQFFFSTSSSFLTDIPPKKTAIFTLFMYLLNLSYSLLIWKASSLVCDMTSTEIYKYLMFLFILKTMWILRANVHNLYL